jgi:hypothetical protein
MISATIPLKRKRIPKQFFEAPAAAAAPPAVTAAAAKKGGRTKTKAAGPRGAPPSKVKTKAVSRIGLAPPPPSKATAPPPSVPSAAMPAPPPPSMDVDKVFDVESTTLYMGILFYGVGIRGLLARTSFRPVESEYRALYSRFSGQKNSGSVRYALTVLPINSLSRLTGEL